MHSAAQRLHLAQGARFGCWRSLDQIGWSGANSSFSRPTAVRPRLPPAAVRIEMDVLVPRRSSLAVVVGSGGRQIHAITDAAAKELEEMWGHPVHLILRPKVAA